MVLGRSDGDGARAAETGAAPGLAEGASGARRRERREALAPLRKKIKDCERAIEKLRAEIQKLDRELAEPDLYAREPEQGGRRSPSDAPSACTISPAPNSEWLDLSEELEAAEAAEIRKLTVGNGRGREGFRLPALRTVRAVFPHTALQLVVSSSGVARGMPGWVKGEQPGIREEVVGPALMVGL